MVSIQKKKILKKIIDLINIETEWLNITLMNYGAMIYTLYIPDIKNSLENVVIAYSDLKFYIKNNRHVNATIGPTAGRIENACFKIGSNKYHLDKNNVGKHNLHGGAEALSYTLFDYDIEELDQKTTVSFFTTKEERKNGFPGVQNYRIVYTISKYEVKIDFFATTDKATLVNLTNHTYFNLSGNLKNNVLNQKMMIRASNKMTSDKELIPFSVENILNTPYDFNNIHPISKDILLEIDDVYILDEVNDKIVQASLFDKNSKRKLEVYTTYPSIVCYTDNFPMTEPLMHNANNEQHMGVCFEAQKSPKCKNFDKKEPSILLPSKKYHNTTRFVFSVKE